MRPLKVQNEGKGLTKHEMKAIETYTYALQILKNAKGVRDPESGPGWIPSGAIK